MKSGIYLLTFNTRTCYIGKSVDIGVRYNQHLEKFRKGTHSKKMQAQYNLSGSPKCEALCLAHPDHLDILEAVYIDKYHKHYGDRLLNSQFPPVPPGGEVLLNHLELLQYSTGNHLTTLVNYNTKLNQANDLVNSYKKQGKILPHELDRLGQLEAEVLRLRNYRNLPWWRKIFT